MKVSRRAAQPTEMIRHCPQLSMSNHFLHFELIKHAFSCEGGKDDYGFLL